jgi:hypothetical protein
MAAAGAAGLADNYRTRLTEHLARLACKVRWGNGSVAAGVVRRALRPDFKGDMPALYDRLKADDCPAARTLSRPALRSLATAADLARGN